MLPEVHNIELQLSTNYAVEGLPIKDGPPLRAKASTFPGEAIMEYYSILSMVSVNQKHKQLHSPISKINSVQNIASLGTVYRKS